jgi:hypothetical protein
MIPRSSYPAASGPSSVTLPGAGNSSIIDANPERTFTPASAPTIVILPGPPRAPTEKLIKTTYSDINSFPHAPVINNNYNPTMDNKGNWSIGVDLTNAVTMVGSTNKYEVYHYDSDGKVTYKSYTYAPGPTKPVRDVSSWTGWCSGLMSFSPDGGTTVIGIPYSIQGTSITDAKKNVSMYYDFQKADIPDTDITVGQGGYSTVIRKGTLGLKVGSSHFYANIGESVEFHIAAINTKGSTETVFKYPKLQIQRSDISYYNFNLGYGFEDAQYSSSNTVNYQPDIIFSQNNASPKTVPPNYLPQGNSFWIAPAVNEDPNEIWYISVNGTPIYKNDQGLLSKKAVYQITQETKASYLNNFSVRRYSFNKKYFSEEKNWPKSPIRVDVTRKVPETQYYSELVDNYIFYIDRNKQYWNQYPTSVVTGFFSIPFTVDAIGASTIINSVDTGYAQGMYSTLVPISITGTPIIQSHSFGAKNASISADGKTLSFSSKYKPKFPLYGNITIAGADDANNYGTDPKTISLVFYNPQPQTVTCPNPVGPNATTAIPGFYTLSGTSTSNLPVVYTTSNSGVAIITGRNGVTQLNVISPGAFALYCSQPGNITGFVSSNTITYGYISSLKSQRISWTYSPQSNGIATPPGLPVQSIPLVAASFDYVNGQLQSANGLPVSFTSSNSGVLQISGNYGVPGTVGTATITATQAGNSTYYPAPAVSYNISVGPRPLSLQILGLPATGFANPGGTAQSTTVGNIFRISGLATDSTYSNQQINVVLSYTGVPADVNQGIPAAYIDPSNNGLIIPQATGITNIIATPFPDNNYFTGKAVTGIFVTSGLNCHIDGIYQADGTLISGNYPANTNMAFSVSVLDDYGSRLPTAYSQPGGTVNSNAKPKLVINTYSYASLSQSTPDSYNVKFLTTGNVVFTATFSGDQYYLPAAPFSTGVNVVLDQEYFTRGFVGLTNKVVGSSFSLTYDQTPLPSFPYDSTAPNLLVSLAVLSGPAYINSIGQINVTGTGQIQLTASYPAISGVSVGIPTGTVTGTFTGIQQQQTIPDLGLTGQFVYKNVGFQSVRINLPTTTSIGLPVSFAIASGSLKSIVPDIQNPSFGTLNPINSQNIFNSGSQHLDGATFGSEYSGFDTTTIVAYNTGSGIVVAPVYITGFVNSPIYSGAHQPISTINNKLGSY